MLDPGECAKSRRARPRPRARCPRSVGGSGLGPRELWAEPLPRCCVVAVAREGKWSVFSVIVLIDLLTKCLN